MNEENLELEQVENSNSATPTENNIIDEQKPSSNDVVDNKSFTQEQVNGIVRDRINRVYARYGVKDSNELDNLIGKSQAYDIIKHRYEEKKKEIYNLNEKMVFMENDIEPARYDDIRAYFKGKGIDFSNETLINELATHPEWKRIVGESAKPITTIQKISPDRNVVKPSTNERDETAKMFGFRNGFIR